MTRMEWCLSGCGPDRLDPSPRSTFGVSYKDLISLVGEWSQANCCHFHIVLTKSYDLLIKDLTLKYHIPGRIISLDCECSAISRCGHSRNNMNLSTRPHRRRTNQTSTNEYPASTSINPPTTCTNLIHMCVRTKSGAYPNCSMSCRVSWATRDSLS